jgi:hypothetical protein
VTSYTVNRFLLWDWRSATVGLLVLAIGVILILSGLLREAHDSHDVLGSIMRDAGVVMVGTVLVTFLLESVLRRDYDQHVYRRVENGLLPAARRYGLVGVVPKLDFPSLFDTLGDGDELLWHDTYNPTHSTFLPAMTKALSRGARMKMLTINPSSQIAEYRARDIAEGYAHAAFVAGARSARESILDSLRPLAPETRERFMLREYSDMPAAPFYVICKQGRAESGFSSYFFRRASFLEPHMEWTSTNDGFLERMYEYFTFKWEISGPTVLNEASETVPASAPSDD